MKMSLLFKKYSGFPASHVTLSETNSKFAPENGWLEYDRFLLGNPIFRCEPLVSGSVVSRFPWDFTLKALLKTSQRLESLLPRSDFPSAFLDGTFFWFQESKPPTETNK